MLFYEHLFNEPILVVQTFRYFHCLSDLVNIYLFADARTVRTVVVSCLLLLSIFSNLLYLLVSLLGRLRGLLYRLECPLLTVLSLSDLALALSGLGLLVTRRSPADLYLSFCIRQHQTSFSHQTSHSYDKVAASK